jgi:RND family efflux transporter MFP subunit
MKLSRIVLQVVANTLVAVVAFAAGFLFNEASEVHEERREKEARRHMVAAPPTDVAVLRLEPGQYQERLSYVGKVRAWRSATLAFAETGIIERIAVDRGDRVRGPNGDAPGTELATLDSVKFEAAARAARADVEKALWEKEKAESLFEQGSVSEEEVRAMALLHALKETELARAEKVLREATLRAPFTGFIAERFVEEGETASPLLPAYRLVAMDRVRVAVAIPGRRIGEVEIGQEAEVEVEIGLGETVVLSGRVYRIPPAATEQLFEVEVAVDNKTGLLREGMIARARICTRVSPSVFILPLEAVIQVGSLRKVMVVEKGARITDGYFDAHSLPDRVRSELSKRGWDLTQPGWRELSKSEWDRLGLKPVEQLKARVHSPQESDPSAASLRGSGVRVFRVGDVARERVLTSSRIEGDLCLVPDDGTFREGELLIARGQHRVTDGGEVVESQRNELALPAVGVSR